MSEAKGQSFLGISSLLPAVPVRGQTAAWCAADKAAGHPRGSAPQEGEAPMTLQSPEKGVGRDCCDLESSRKREGKPGIGCRSLGEGLSHKGQVVQGLRAGGKKLKVMQFAAYEAEPRCLKGRACKDEWEMEQGEGSPRPTAESGRCPDIKSSTSSE